MKDLIVYSAKFHNYLPLLLIALLVVFTGSGGEKDMQIFVSAANDMWSGKNIYQELYHQWYHYYYDASFAILVSPLQWLPSYWTNVLWGLINIYLTFRIWKICSSFLPIDKLSTTAQKVLPYVVFFMLFALWDRNIRYGQLTIFILYLSLEGLYQIKRDRWIIGGILLGWGITIKIMPIVLIPYLLYRAKYKAAMTTALATVAILFVPSLFIGYDYNTFLIQERWALINPLNSEHILDVSERSFHSLTSLLSILFVENARNSYTLDLKRNITDVDLETLKLIINIVRGTFVLITLWFLRSMPFRKAQSPVQELYELSYIFLIIPLIFPHQQHYAFFFAFPAVVYLTYFMMRTYSVQRETLSPLKKYGLLSLFILIFFLLNSHFLLGEFRNIYDHYKTLTYGILMIIPVLAICRPVRLK